LDDLFLQLTRNYRKRSDVSSTLRTLPAYLEAARHLLLLVIQIPPIDPSTGLRIAYLLRLTGDVLFAITGYKLETSDTSIQETLRDVLEFLGDLDRAWLAVLQSQVWDPSTGQAVDLVVTLYDDSADHQTINPPSNTPSALSIKSTPPSQTELTRLQSLFFTGESSLEEWLTSEKSRADDDADNDDVSGMLDRMGLLDEFDSLFVRTLDFLGSFTGTTAEPVEELVME